MRLGVYLGLVALQLAITYPHFSQTCQGPGSAVYIIHHFFDVFVFWSFLFLTTRTEHIVHLCTILGVVIHWLTNNYECIATTYMNELCGFPREQWLDSMVNRIRPFYYTHIVWLALLVAYDLTWL
jgi:hypothetical protein